MSQAPTVAASPVGSQASASGPAKRFSGRVPARGEAERLIRPSREPCPQRSGCPGGRHGVEGAPPLSPA